MRNNVLSQAEFVLLTEFLKARQDTLQKEGPAYEVVAWQASEVLGFLCTKANMRSVARANGLLWVAKPRKPAQKPDALSLLSSIKGAETMSPGYAIGILAAAILDVYSKIGAEAGLVLKRIARGEVEVT